MFSEGQASMYPYAWQTSGPLPIERLVHALHRAQDTGETIVSTNGCFDVLHPGHIRFLRDARGLGDILVVLINSDRSVKALKGASRPVFTEVDRAEMLLSLKAVDHVVVFDAFEPTSTLMQIRPNIHCKGSDYAAESLPETTAIREIGSEVRILPLQPGYSSSSILGRGMQSPPEEHSLGNDLHPQSVLESVLSQMVNRSNLTRRAGYELAEKVTKAVQILCNTLDNTHKVLICGNGGSAATAQHFAAELVGRFRRLRAALPAIALSADSSIVTSIGNDFGFNEIFARQIHALGQPGDALIVLTSSGQSPNVLLSLDVAKTRGMVTIALTGKMSTPIVEKADLVLPAPSDDVAQIQEIHLAILHVLSDLIDEHTHVTLPALDE